MKSIRAQVELWVVLWLILFFTITELFLNQGIRSVLTRQFDQTLLAKARAFATLSHRTHEDIEGRRVPLAILPPAAMDAIQGAAQDAPVLEVEEVINAGRVIYKVECVSDGVESEFLVDASGEYLGRVDEYGFAIHDASMPEFQKTEAPEYYQVLDEDGETIAKSPSLVGSHLATIEPRGDDADFLDTTLPDGREGRLVALRFRPSESSAAGADRGSEELILVMARSTMDLSGTLRRLRRVLLFFEVLCVFGVIAVVRLTVRRGLAPLDALARQAAVIGADNLETRFPKAGLPSELTVISARLNDFLDRLEAAFAREKRFTADVAHELRTPIAELRALTEVGLRVSGDQNPESGGSQYLHDARAIALQMERLVNALLTLARCESHQHVVTIEPIDLSALLKDAWEPFADRAADRSLRVSFAMPDEAWAESDRALLLAILTNVLSNVIDYTTDGGDVSVEIVKEANVYNVHISNSTGQLTPADLPHLTEPFWRKDEARSGTSHSGVGLAIVASLARLLVLDLALALPAPDRFTVTLEGIPASEP